MDKKAASWSAAGAIEIVCFAEECIDAMLHMSDIVEACDPYAGLAQFNDTHTHEEVLALFDKAIAQAEEDERKT